MNELLISLQGKISNMEGKSLEHVEGFMSVFEELADYVEVHDDNKMHKILVDYMKKDINSLVHHKKAKFNYVTK
jgi:hypothetical protein